MKIVFAVIVIALIVGMIALAPDKLPTMGIAIAACAAFGILFIWQDSVIPVLLIAVPFPKVIADIVSIQPTGTTGEIVRFQPGLTPGDFLIGLATAACLLRLPRDPAMWSRCRLAWRSGPGKPLVVFWLIAAVSLWGLDSGTARTCFLYLAKLGEGFICYFLTFLLVRDARTWTRCFKIALLMGALVACAALVMFAAGVSVADSGERRGLAPFFFTGGQSDFGSYLVLFIAAYLSLFLVKFRRGEIAYRALVPIVPMVVCLLLLYERHLVIGLTAAAFTLGWLTRGTARILLISVLVLIFGVGIAIVPATVTRAEETFERSGDTAGYYNDTISLGAPQAIADYIENSNLDSSSRHRMLRWVGAATAFWHHPVLGVGFWADVLSGVGPSHSQYLKILAEMGLVGFASYIWLCWRVCKTVKWVMKGATNPRVQALALALAATLSALFVQGFFALTISLIRVAPVLWLIIGLTTVSRYCFADTAHFRWVMNRISEQRGPMDRLAQDTAPSRA